MQGPRRRRARSDAGRAAVGAEAHESDLTGVLLQAVYRWRARARLITAFVHPRRRAFVMVPSMAGSLHCAECDIHWPRVYALYKACPECGRVCVMMAMGQPIPETEARSRRLHAEFERFYQARESRRMLATQGEIERLPTAEPSVADL